MKTAAKVFIWIGMVASFFLIYPIVVGIIALDRLEKATTKGELQTIGVLTLIFCNVLGGIFLLCIKDEELVNDGANRGDDQLISGEDGECVEEKDGKARLAIKIMWYVQLALVVSSIPYAICAIVFYRGVTYIPLILVSVQVALLAVILPIYISRQHRMSKLLNVLTFVFLGITVLQAIMVIMTNYSFAFVYDYTCWPGYDTTGLYEYNCYYPNEYNGYMWESWVLFALAIISTALSISTCVMSIRTKQAKVTSVRSDTAVVRSDMSVQILNIEVDLNNVKRLFDNEVLTEEEYLHIRKFIINKYYPQS